MTLVYLVAKIISSYHGYQIANRKEDDLLVKRRLLREIKSIKNHLKNSQEMLVKKTDKSSIKEINLVYNTLDTFSNEIEYSISGHTYPFFSQQTSVGNRKLNKVIKFDLSLLENISKILKQTEKFETNILNSNLEDNNILIKEIRKNITDVRDEFKNRIDLIKKI